MPIGPYIFLYLAGGLAANLTLTVFGPEAAVYNAFLFIGLLLVCRDRIQDHWRERPFPKMAGLIAVATGLVFAFNPAGGRIALAGAAAFLVTELVDYAVYRLRWQRPWLERSNVSNVAAAAVDSVLFPLLAFNTLSAAITFEQFAAKVAGALVFTLVFLYATAPDGPVPGSVKAEPSS